MGLIERLQENVEATSWRGEIPMSYVYTAGRAGEAFFQALKERGEILGARCEALGVTYVPAQMFCERTFERLEDAYVPVPNRGVVHTFSVVHETYDEKPQEPVVIALVQFEGTEGGLFHKVDVAPEDCHIGMPVEAVLEPEGDRKGGLLDIRHFRPL